MPSIIRIFTIVVILTAIQLNGNVEKKTQCDKVFTVLLYFFLFHNSFDTLIFLLGGEEFFFVIIGAPFGLAYGPLIYFCFLSAKSELSYRKVIQHSMLPVLYGFIFISFVLEVKFRQIIGDLYYITLYIFISLSNFGYSIYLIAKKKAIPHDKMFILYLAFYFLLVSLFMVFLNIIDTEWPIPEVISGVYVDILLLTGSMICFFSSLHRFKEYVLIKRSWILFSQTYKKTDEKKNALVSTPEVIYKSKETELLDSFFKSAHIINPDLNLKDAAFILKLSQKSIVESVKQTNNTSFTKILAVKRIEMTCRFLEDVHFNDEYDTLSTRFGFKSKATFYRNFFLFKHCSPSEYRINYINSKSTIIQ